MNIVGNNIRRFRLLNKLKLREVAKALGLSPSYISHIERGRRHPDSDLMMAMAKVLKCAPQDFFEDRSTITYVAALNKLQITENDLVLVKLLRKLQITSPEQVEQMHRLNNVVRKEIEV